MTDELAVLKLVTARLEAAGIAYMITGSIAAGYYAEPRMTRDVDLVVELEPDDVAVVANLFTPEILVDAEVTSGGCSAPCLAWTRRTLSDGPTSWASRTCSARRGKEARQA